MSHFPETADIETSSDGYAQRFAGAVGAWFLRVQEDATLRLLHAFPNARILDVGGGHGQLAPPLYAMGIASQYWAVMPAAKSAYSHW